MLSASYFLKNANFGLKFYGRFEYENSEGSILIASGANAFLGMPIGAPSRRSAITKIHLKSGAKLSLENNSIIGSGCSILLGENGKISIGENSYIAANSIIGAGERVEIGNNCMISWEVTIIDDDGHTFKTHSQIEPIKIGDNVWIGTRAVILKGVVLGNGCVVGAGSVVTKSFPKNSIIGGVPARLIKTKQES